MYKHIELHNHTIESDGSLTPLELIRFMEENRVDAFALTDHNTISGHDKVRHLLKEFSSPLECIYGMEYTTYYGHILCFNLAEYIPFENINLHKPELLFRAVREKGAIAGIAHPFSFGHPFARGCRFDMTITDYTSFDFVEVINNSEPLLAVNQKGLLWWEELVLQGYALAATSGLDLHRCMDMNNQYATFIKEETGVPIAVNLANAVREGRTHISKGPLIDISPSEEIPGITIQLIDSGKQGYTYSADKPYLITLRNAGGVLVKQLDQRGHVFVAADELESRKSTIVKLYEKTTDIENLIAIAPVLR